MGQLHLTTVLWVLSDALISGACFVFFILLFGLVKKIKVRLKPGLFVIGAFILTCGVIHLIEMLNIKEADYWTGIWVKVITAIASVASVLFIYRLRRPILQLAEGTHELEMQVDERTSELNESQILLNQLIEKMPQLVWVTSPGGKISFFNQRWFDYTGLTAEESLAGKWKDLLHPEDFQRTTEHWQQCLYTGQTYQIEYRFKNRKGEYRWQLARGIPLKNSKGKIIQWFGTNTDIQEQKEAEAKLKEALAARDQFLSVASHELNTPLTSLLLQSQMYEKKFQDAESRANPENIKRFLSIVYKQGHRLSTVISDMLDVSKIQANRFHYNFEIVNFPAFAQEVLGRLCHQFEAGKCRIIYDLPEDTHAHIDTFRIEQVFNNILNNAAKYAPGSPLEVRLILNKECIRIEIKDMGPGISDENLTKIFSKFERAYDENEQSGLGLGLFISKEIVSEHQGRIWAESAPNEGATFIIEIPNIRINENGEIS